MTNPSTFKIIKKKKRGENDHIFLGVIIFDSVWFLSKKVTKPKFFLKKPKPVQTDRVRFGSVFLGQ
jgi:hypothetical protein